MKNPPISVCCSPSQSLTYIYSQRLVCQLIYSYIHRLGAVTTAAPQLWGQTVPFVPGSCDRNTLHSTQSPDRLCVCDTWYTCCTLWLIEMVCVCACADVTVGSCLGQTKETVFITEINKSFPSTCCFLCPLLQVFDCEGINCRSYLFMSDFKQPAIKTLCSCSFTFNSFTCFFIYAFECNITFNILARQRHPICQSII